MSYTELFGIPKNGGKLVLLGECHNSWRGAMWIWDHMAQKHFNKDSGWVLCGDNIQKVCDLAKITDTNKALSDTEYYALLTTFDGVLVPNELMNKVADALENFEPSTENLRQQAQILRSAQAKGYQAVCWNQTSVNDMWMVHEEEEDRLFNIDIDKDFKHWFMEDREPDEPDETIPSEPDETPEILEKAERELGLKDEEDLANWITNRIK